MPFSALGHPEKSANGIQLIGASSLKNCTLDGRFDGFEGKDVHTYVSAALQSFKRRRRKCGKERKGPSFYEQPSFIGGAPFHQV